MSVDFSTLPFSPLLVVVGLGYAVFSSEVSGPLMINRELNKSGWHQRCQSELLEDTRTNTHTEPLAAPMPDIGGMICGVFPELGDLCRIIPDPTIAARELEKRAQGEETARFARVAIAAPSICACAQDVFVSSERVSVALYAASGRLITTPALQNREAGLSRALNSPLCRGEGHS